MKNLLFTFLALIFIVFACEEEPDTFQPDYGFDYFPMEIGDVRHYTVDSIYFDTSEPRFDSTRTQLQEVLTNILFNNNGDTIMRIERSERVDSISGWRITDIYSEQLDEVNMYRKEENVRFLKLTFPPTVNKSWDGNAEIPEDKIVFVAGETIEMFKSWDYRILSKGEPEEINGYMFDDVLTVQLADSDSEIEYRYGIEKYARGVGLIYRELWILDTQCKGCCNAPDGTIPVECTILPWEERADEGFIIVQKYAEY
jgi:hypothetical protein